jgi:hypothetical protein
MSKKPTISTISSGYASNTQLNNNFSALRTGFDNTLSLDGSTPNAMNADFDMNGNNILNASQVNVNSLLINGVAVVPGDVTLQTTYLTASYTGDGSQVAYALTANPQTEGNVSIYIDGVYQNKDTFSLSGTTITFSEAPPLNSAIEIVYPSNTDTLNGTTADLITYNQGSTGAQDRTLTNKLQESVSVKDFGATGDGVTDDTVNIQATVDAVSQGATIYIPVGTYKVSTRINCSAKRVRFLGEGRSSKISWTNATGADCCFETENANGYGLVIEKLWISGARSGSSNQEVDGYALKAYGSGGVYCRDSGVIDCYITGCAGIASTYLADGVQVLRNRVESCVNAGGNSSLGWYMSTRFSLIADNIEEDDTAAYAVILHNTVTSTTVGQDVHIVRNKCINMIAMRYHKKVLVDGNFVNYTNGDSYSGALLVTNGMEDVTVVNNEFRGADGNTNTGGVIRVTDGVNRIKIANNTVRSYGGIGNGIDLANVVLTGHCIIDGNSIIDESGTNTLAGIHIEPSGAVQEREIIISDNYIEGFTDGVLLYPDVQRAVISGNVFDGQVSRAINVDAASGYAGKVIITKNHCDKSIAMKDGDFSSIEGNYGISILVENANNVSVTDNVLNDANPSIQVEADRCLVSGNHLRADGTGGTGGTVGIWITSTSEGSTVTANRINGLSQANAVGIKSNGTNVLIAVNFIDDCWRGLETVAGGSYATAGDNLILNAGAGGATSFAGTSLAASLA